MRNRYATFAWSVLAYNLGVILWGAYVRATGSGAGCGSHWPLCNGEVVPRAEAAETLIELTHRATSGLALVAVVALWWFARKRFAPGHRVRVGAQLSLIFIIVEALLGAGLVLFELVADDDSWFRAFSMIAHLVNTFVLVAVLALTAWWASGGRPVRLTANRKALGWLAAGAMGIILVGATGAIAALGDTLFPSATLGDGLRESFSKEAHPLIQLRKFHPLAAIVVGAGLVAIARIISGEGSSRATERFARLLAVVYATQIVAGAVNIILLAPIALQLTHLLLADLLWIAFVLFGASSLSDGVDKSAALDTTGAPSIAGARHA